MINPEELDAMMLGEAKEGLRIAKESGPTDFDLQILRWAEVFHSMFNVDPVVACTMLEAGSQLARCYDSLVGEERAAEVQRLEELWDVNIEDPE